MAEDREDGSPGEEAEQFEVLDEVGEVEGWDGEFPDDDDEQDMDDEDEQVGETEERAVADSVPQSNKTQETVATENEHVCVKPSSVEKNNSSAADKEEKEQSQMSLNRESSRKDVKSEPAVSKEVQSNEATASKDVILIDLCASEDGMVKEASARRHAPSKEASASIDALSKDASASTDAPSKEASASRVAPSEEVSASIDAPSNESCASRDAPSNESMDSALKRTDDDPEVQGLEGKKMKLCIERMDFSKSQLVVKNINNKQMKMTIKKLDDDKFKILKVEGEEERSCGPERSSNMQGEGSAFKRKSDNEVQKPEEAKKMKLLCGKEDNSLPSVEEIEVISTDPRKAHHIRKELFMNTMHKLSEELKRGKEYRSWVQKMRKDGMMFPVFDIDVPAKPILFNNCQLVSGYENDSTTLCLGFARIDKVLRYSALEAIYVPEVRSTIKAFEEMVQSCSKPLFDPCTLQGYWHGVNVTTNSKGEILLKVDLFAANEQEGEVRFAEAKDILVKFFSSERPELNCHISGMYLRLVFTKTSSTVKVASERTASRCIMGSEFIVETIGDIKIRLYPWSFFSTGTAAMTSLCEKMLKVLFQEGCETVVELGCGTGIVGHFLAKHCANVLGVDLAECIAEAKVNADENHLSNCTYFDGKEKDVWKTLGDALRSKSSAMVIVNALNYDYLAMDPAVLAFLQCTEGVHRVVYVKCLDIFNENMLGFLSLPIKVVRRRPEDRLPHIPLYATALDLGTETYTAIVVFQHVEKDFVKELYADREKYWVHHISRSPFIKQNILVSTNNAKGKLKSPCETLPPTKIKLLERNLSDRNLSKAHVGIAQIKDKDKIPVSKDNSKAGNTVDLKGGYKEGSRLESVKRNVVVGRNNVNQGNVISRSGPQLLEHGTTRKMCSSSLPRKEQKKDKYAPVMGIGEARPYIRGMQASSSRVVDAQLRKPYRMHVVKVSSPPRKVQNVQAEKQGCAELAVLTDDIRANRLVQKVISEDRNTKMVVPKFSIAFTDDIVPPGTEDSETLLQEKKSKMDKDIDIQRVSGSDGVVREKAAGATLSKAAGATLSKATGATLSKDAGATLSKDAGATLSEATGATPSKAAGAVQGKTTRRFRFRSRLYKRFGNIKGNNKNVEHIIYKRPTMLPPDVEAWDAARYRWAMQDAARSPDSKFYGLGVRHWPRFIRDTPEEFPLVKDGVQFDTHIGTDENRRATFEELRGDMKYTRVKFRGSSSGRTFDNAELERKVRPRTDDIASGIKTDVRSMNIRTEGWNFRDDMHNVERIRDGFQKFNASKGSNLLEFKDLHHHEKKTAPAVDRAFPHVSDKHTYPEWFAVNDKSRSVIDDVEINRAKISIPEDRNRTLWERNTLSLVTKSKRQQHMDVGESTREKKYGEVYVQGSVHSSWLKQENASMPKKPLEMVQQIPVLNSRRLGSGVKQAKTERNMTLVSSQQNSYQPYEAASAVQTSSSNFIPSGVDSHVDRSGPRDSALAWTNTSSQGRLETTQGPPFTQKYVVAQPGPVQQPPLSWGVPSAPQLLFDAEFHRNVPPPPVIKNYVAVPASFPENIATGGMVKTTNVRSSVSQGVSPLQHGGNSVETFSTTSSSLAPSDYDQISKQVRKPGDVPSFAYMSTISPKVVRPFSDVSRSGMFL